MTDFCPVNLSLFTLTCQKNPLQLKLWRPPRPFRHEESTTDGILSILIAARTPVQAKKDPFSLIARGEIDFDQPESKKYRLADNRMADDPAVP